jgi:hypothetical protein
VEFPRSDGQGRSKRGNSNDDPGVVGREERPDTEHENRHGSQRDRDDARLGDALAAVARSCRDPPVSLYLLPAYPGTASAVTIVNGVLGLAIPMATLVGQVSWDRFAAISLGQIAVRARDGQNATKHAGSDARVTITLGRDRDRVRFAVVDDGVGMDPSAADGEGDGLTSMRDRIGAVSGDLEITSTPGRGTTIRATVPDISVQ